MILLLTDVFLLLTQVLLWMVVGLVAWFVLLKALPRPFLSLLVLLLILVVLALSFVSGPPTDGTVLEILWRIISFPFSPLGLGIILLAILLSPNKLGKVVKRIMLLGLIILALGSLPIVAYYLVQELELEAIELICPAPALETGARRVIVLLGQGTTRPYLRPATATTTTTQEGAWLPGDDAGVPSLSEAGSRMLAQLPLRSPTAISTQEAGDGEPETGKLPSPLRSPTPSNPLFTAFLSPATAVSRREDAVSPPRLNSMQGETYRLAQAPAGSGEVQPVQGTPELQRAQELESQAEEMRRRAEQGASRLDELKQRADEGQQRINEMRRRAEEIEQRASELRRRAEERRQRTTEQQQPETPVERDTRPRQPTTPLAPASPAAARPNIVITRDAYDILTRQPVQLTDRGNRLIYAAQLYQQESANNPLILVSASTHPSRRQKEGERREDISEAADVQRFLTTTLRVPASGILLEHNSRSIQRSAVNVRRLLADQNINFGNQLTLVTTAMNMNRAAWTFWRAFDNNTAIVVRPTDFHTLPSPASIGNLATGTNLIERQIQASDFLPSADALYLSTQAVEEYLASFYYFLRGWIRPLRDPICPTPIPTPTPTPTPTPNPTPIPQIPSRPGRPFPPGPGPNDGTQVTPGTW